MNCIHKHSIFITLLKIIFNIYLLDNVYKMNKEKKKKTRNLHQLHSSTSTSSYFQNNSRPSFTQQNHKKYINYQSTKKNINFFEDDGLRRRALQQLRQHGDLVAPVGQADQGKWWSRQLLAPSKKIRLFLRFIDS